MMELERRERGVRLGVGEERSEGLAMERGDMGSVEKKEPRHFCETDFPVCVSVSPWSKEGQEGRVWKRAEHVKEREKKG